MKNFFSKISKHQIHICFFFLASVFVISACSSRNRKLQQRPQNYKENLVKANKGLVDLDKEKIESYVKRRNWDMKVSETGLWYNVFESKGGEKASLNKIAHLKYQVNLLDGTVCYTSDSLGLMQFKIGKGGVESGLEEAILMMGVGDKARFVMPPHLAHGLLGDSDKIPPRSIIVYQAELIKLTDF